MLLLGAMYLLIRTLSQWFNVMGSNFKITFISEKHVVEDDVLFTNHLAEK